MTRRGRGRGSPQRALFHRHAFNTYRHPHAMRPVIRPAVLTYLDEDSPTLLRAPSNSTSSLLALSLALAARARVKGVERGCVERRSVGIQTRGIGCSCSCARRRRSPSASCSSRRVAARPHRSVMVNSMMDSVCVCIQLVCVYSRYLAGLSVAKLTSD